jgi:hypothetical protein
MFWDWKSGWGILIGNGIEDFAGARRTREGQG